LYHADNQLITTYFSFLEKRKVTKEIQGQMKRSAHLPITRASPCAATFIFTFYHVA
jgi:hypothetical protein